MATNNLAIGFAEKMFTLWQSSYDKTTKSYKFIFIKNISKDIEKVKELYPGIEVDTSLRGRVVWKQSDKVYYNYETGIFPFGKYAGKKIFEADINYLVWLFSEMQDEKNIAKASWWTETLPEVTKILDDNGYIIANGRVYQKDQYEISEDTNIDLSIKNGNSIEIDFTSNIDEFGEYRFKNVFLKFSEISEQYYNGYQYYLPVINGKAKRVKGKTIEITDYEIIEEDYIPNTWFENTLGKYVNYPKMHKILVKSFKIVKK